MRTDSSHCVSQYSQIFIAGKILSDRLHQRCTRLDKKACLLEMSTSFKPQ